MSIESVKWWLELAQQASEPPNREQYEMAVAHLRYEMPAALAVVEAAAGYMATIGHMAEPDRLPRLIALRDTLAAFEASND